MFSSLASYSYIIRGDYNIMMDDKFLRVLNLVTAIEANPGITVKRLAQRFHVSKRTIYRDLSVASRFAPITNAGRGAGYRLITKFALYPLDFTEEEGIVMTMLPSLVHREKMPPAFDTAYDKVMATHFKEQTKQREIIDRFSEIIQMAEPAYNKNTTNFFHLIIQAIMEQRAIDTTYHTQYRNETSQRQIHPYCIVPRGNRFYLIGHCCLKGGLRTFRISRFQSVQLMNDKFDPGDFNLKHYLRNTWSIERGQDDVTFKVRFSPAVARYVKEEEMFVTPILVDEPDGSLLFEVRVNSEKEFMKWILQYGPDAEIIEPEAVRNRMHHQLTKWLQLYRSLQ